MERVARSSSAFALFAQLPEGVLAVDRLHQTALEIVAAAVERLADRGHLFEIPGEGVLDDVLRSTSADRGEIFQLLGRFGRGVESGVIGRGGVNARTSSTSRLSAFSCCSCCGKPSRA